MQFRVPHPLAAHVFAAALLLPTAALAQGTYDNDPAVREALTRLATQDPATQQARWGALAGMAGKPWLTATPGDVANVWRNAQWVVPGAVMRYQRGFCIAGKCQGTEYLVQYNDRTRQLELFEEGKLAYTGRMESDGSLRLAGTSLLGALTPEVLRYDAATGTLFADKHELKGTTNAQLATSTRGYADGASVGAQQTGGTTAAAADQRAAAKPANAPAPSSSEAELRAELAAMRANMEQLSKQVEQKTAQAAPTTPAAPPPGETAAEKRARLAEEKRAQAAEARRIADEKRQQAAEEKRLAAEAKLREQQERAAEARRLADEKRAQQEDARKAAEAAKARPWYAAIAVGTEIKHSGWSVDHPSLESAQKEALDNCNRTGDYCEVVLAWSGHSCGAYRAHEEEADIYGSGVGPTNVAAASKAFDAASKLGRGKATHQVQVACNKTASTAEPTVHVNAARPLPRMKTVRIGRQTWAAANLSTWKYADGTPIPRARTKDEYFAMAKTGPVAFVAKGREQYGVRYNFAVVGSPRGICPRGFHVPTLQEWDVLFRHLGGGQRAHDAMLRGGGSGFEADLAGYEAHYSSFGEIAEWWTTTVHHKDPEFIMQAQLHQRSGDSPSRFSNRDRRYGATHVRCLQD